MLSNIVNHLKRKIDNGFISCTDAYKSASTNLEKLDLDVANGACVRSRDQWIEEGETSSKFSSDMKRKIEWIDGLLH